MISISTARCLVAVFLLTLVTAPVLASSRGSCSPPEAPCSVAVEAMSPDSFLVTWQDSVGEASYRVERKKGCCRGFVTVVDDLTADTVSYLDDSGQGTCESPIANDDLCCDGEEGGGDLTFAYRVVALDGLGGETLSTNEASNPLPCTPPRPCAGAGGDSDGDGVCAAADRCPGFDDGADADGDGIPDGCEGTAGALIAPFASEVFSGGTIEDDFLLLLLRLHEAAPSSDPEAAFATRIRNVDGEDLQLPPWYEVSHRCDEDSLKESVVGQTFPGATYDRYLVNGDELSELAVAEAMGDDEERMLAIHRSVQRLVAGAASEGNGTGLPCWIARLCLAPADCSGAWSGEALECVSTDSATDVTARLGLAYYLASHNLAFSSGSRAVFRIEARALAAAHLEHEYFTFAAGACPTGSLSSGDGPRSAGTSVSGGSRSEAHSL